MVVLNPKVAGAVARAPPRDEELWAGPALGLGGQWALQSGSSSVAGILWVVGPPSGAQEAEAQGHGSWDRGPRYPAGVLCLGYGRSRSTWRPHGLAAARGCAGSVPPQLAAAWVCVGPVSCWTGCSCGHGLLC